MSQTVALLIHEIMDSPDRFRADSSHITNGYYRAALDGSSYGMGASNYTASGAEREMLIGAVNAWKRETGWTQPQYSTEPTQAAPVLRMTFDTYSKKTYEEFARTVRNNLKSFGVHHDANTFSNGVQKALEILDNAIRQIDAVNADAK